jgi:hypothetical protein
MDDLITVAVFDNAMEAGRARAQLGHVGIHGVLRPEDSGQIRLEVAGEDAQAAIDLLDQKTWRLSGTAEDETAFATPETLQRLPPAPNQDADDKPLSPREKLATKTLRLTVFSLAVPVLLPIALLLFARLCFSRGKLQGPPRRHAQIVGLIFGSLTLFFLVICAGVFWGPHDDVNLHDLPHPDALVGAWAAKADDDERPLIAMELRANGNLRYQESSAAPVDATGTWAFTNHHVYIRLDRVNKGSWPWQGKIVGWELVRFTDKELLLKSGNGDLVLRRLK